MLVFNFQSLNSAFAEVVSLTPCVQKFRDSWTQNLVWRGVLNPSDFQPTVDSWSRLKWERSTTINSAFRSPCSVYKPFPVDIFLDINTTGGTSEGYLKSGIIFCLFCYFRCICNYINFPLVS